MTYALFSDIHGNIYALKSMLADLCNDDVDGYLFCGDITGYYYSAGEIVEIFQKLPSLHIVRGNHDAIYLKALTDAGTRQEAAEKYGNAYRNIDTEVTRYIETLPESLSLKIGNFNVIMLHGSPEAPLTGRLYPDTVLDMPLPDCNFLFTGHTHYQMVRACRPSTKVVNPGSLGQPRDGKGFSYCIIDFSTGEIEHRAVKYDMSSLLNEIAKNDPGRAYLTDVLHRNLLSSSE